MENLNGAENTVILFCRQPETEYTVAGLSEKEMITEEDGGIMAYPLFPFDPSRNLEVFILSLMQR